MQLASSVPYVSEDIPVLPRSAAAVNTERECGSIRSAHDRGVAKAIVTRAAVEEQMRSSGDVWLHGRASLLLSESRSVPGATESSRDFRVFESGSVRLSGSRPRGSVNSRSSSATQERPKSRVRGYRVRGEEAVEAGRPACWRRQRQQAHRARANVAPPRRTRSWALARDRSSLDAQQASSKSAWGDCGALLRFDRLILHRVAYPT